MRKSHRFTIALVVLCTIAVLIYFGIKGRGSVQAASTIVYITRTGECYHLANCMHLRKSKIPKTLEYAHERYRPCSRCRPPTDYYPNAPPDDSYKPRTISLEELKMRKRIGSRKPPK